MSLLKKKYKIIIIVIACVITLISGLFFVLKKNPIKLEFITLSNEYFVVNSDNNNYINVPIYVDIKDTEFMNADNIETIYLTNRSEDELYPVEIEYITYLDTALHNDKKYYQYDVKLNLMFISNEMIKISDLYLKAIYPNDITVKLKLGSLVLYNYKTDQNLSYSSLKGLVQVWNNKTMLSGVLVKLSSSLDYTITSIKTISNFAEIDSVYTERYFLEDFTIGDYIKSVNYMDKCIGMFLDNMNKEGLLDNTVIVIYGDHDARISKKQYDYMYNYDSVNDRVLEEDDDGYKEFNDYDYELSKSVPLIIWSKDFDGGKVISTPMGMIDVMPTLGNMLNIYNKYALGNDIMDIDDGENIVVFKDGSYVTSKIYYSAKNNEVYTLSNEVISEDYISMNSDYANMILDISNDVIVFDLLKDLE